MVLDVSTDPSLRMLRSGFGKQVVSVNSTTAAFGFGTAGRDNYSKVLVLQPHVCFTGLFAKSGLLNRSSTCLLNKPRRCRAITVWGLSIRPTSPSALSRTPSSPLRLRLASEPQPDRSNTEATHQALVRGSRRATSMGLWMSTLWERQHDPGH